MVNGYVTLDLTSKNIYKESLGAIKAQKPVMVVDAPQVYFADTIKATTIDDEPVVQITKGGKTITIANDNTITNVGDIQNHLYLYQINFTDYSFNIMLPFKFEGFSVASNDDLTDEIVDILKKIFNTYTNNGLKYSIFSAYSENIDDLITHNGEIRKSTNTFILSVTYYINSTKTVESVTFNEDFSSVTISDGDLYVNYLAQIY